MRLYSLCRDIHTGGEAIGPSWGDVKVRLLHPLSVLQCYKALGAAAGSHQRPRQPCSRGVLCRKNYLHNLVLMLCVLYGALNIAGVARRVTW